MSSAAVRRSRHEMVFVTRTHVLFLVANSTTKQGAGKLELDLSQSSYSSFDSADREVKRRGQAQLNMNKNLVQKVDYGLVET